MSSQQLEKMPMWHSLMYSSGFLMSLSVVPGVPLLALHLWHTYHLPPRYALYASGVLYAIVAALGASLWVGAILITKYQASRASRK
jgi:hypothetical protein